MALRLRPLAPPLPLRRRTLDVAWRCPANTTLVVDKPPGVTRYADAGCFLAPDG